MNKRAHMHTHTIPPPPQVGVFFPMILLKPFEPPTVPGVSPVAGAGTGSAGGQHRHSRRLQA